MSVLDYCILAVLTICFAAAIFNIVRRKKTGCCGDCAACSGSCAQTGKKVKA